MNLERSEKIERWNIYPRFSQTSMPLTERLRMTPNTNAPTQIQFELRKLIVFLIYFLTIMKKIIFFSKRKKKSVLVVDA